VRGREPRDRETRARIYNFGNASAFDPEVGLVAIKPSGVAYRISREDMIRADLEGKIVEGRSDFLHTRTHLMLFREMRGIGGVVHTHSTYATGWRRQRRHPDPPDHTRRLPRRGCASPELMSAEATAGDYEAETGVQILDCFRDAILENADGPGGRATALSPGGKAPSRRSTTPWSWRRSPGWHS